jgi:endonuclease G
MVGGMLVFSVVVFSTAAYQPPAANATHAPQPATSKTATTPAAPFPARSATWGSTYYYGGIPKPTPSFTDTLVVLTNTGYVAGFDEHYKEPAWVCYRLFAASNHQATPRPQGFSVDRRTYARVAQSDYARSGYDRGHLAPNHAIALCYGPAAQLETFLMSNIIPQRPNLNRKIWQRLERLELDHYAAAFGQVWVIVGPAFSKARLPSGVAVPSACFKILVVDHAGTPQVLALLIPQNVGGAESPDQFITSIDAVERATGLDFLPDLPKELQDRLEGRKAESMWAKTATPPSQI